MSATVPQILPAGTILHPLEPHVDDRGSFTELYRAEWDTVRPIQSNASVPRPGALTATGPS